MMVNYETLPSDIDNIIEFIGVNKKYFLLINVDFLEISLGEKYIRDNDMYTMSISKCVTNIGYFEGLMFKCFIGVISRRMLLAKADFKDIDTVIAYPTKNRYILFLTDDKKQFIKMKLRCENQIFSGER